MHACMYVYSTLAKITKFLCRIYGSSSKISLLKDSDSWSEIQGMKKSSEPRKEWLVAGTPPQEVVGTQIQHEKLVFYKIKKDGIQPSRDIQPVLLHFVFIGRDNFIVNLDNFCAYILFRFPFESMELVIAHLKTMMKGQ